METGSINPLGCIDLSMAGVLVANMIQDFLLPDRGAEGMEDEFEDSRLSLEQASV